jgi:hypothetical protein
VAELALDDDERYAFVGHFDSVGVLELTRSEASPDARFLDTGPGAPEDHDQATQASPGASSPAVA